MEPGVSNLPMIESSSIVKMFRLTDDGVVDLYLSVVGDEKMVDYYSDFILVLGHMNFVYTLDKTW